MALASDRQHVEHEMADLTNPRLICIKGFLFLLCGLMSAALLILSMPGWRNAFLLCTTVWGFCRFYFFAFYVIERYVDERCRFSGLIDFMRFFMQHRGNSYADKPPPREEPGVRITDF